MRANSWDSVLEQTITVNDLDEVTHAGETADAETMQRHIVLGYVATEVDLRRGEENWSIADRHICSG